MEIDPDYLAAAAEIPDIPLDWARDAPDVLRAAYDEMRAVFKADLPGDVAIQCLTLPGPDGPLGARLFLPETAAKARGRTPAAILFFHGGGWVVGSSETHELFAAMLARDAGLPLVSLDYRLAPEAAFPAQREDGLAALRQLVEKGLGALPPVERLVLCGDSAGAAISFWVEIGLPAELRPAVVGVAGLYGAYGLFDSLRGRRLGRPEEGLGHQSLKRMYATLGPLDRLALTPGFDILDSVTAEGPPVYLLASEIDAVADDSVLLAERLEALGRPLTQDWVADLPHGFLHFAARVPAAGASLARVGRWIAKQFD